MRNFLRFFSSGGSTNHAVSYEASSGARRKTSHVHLGREFEGTLEERCHLTEDVQVDMDPNASSTGGRNPRSLNQNKPHPLSKASSVVDGFFSPRKHGAKTRRPRSKFFDV